MEISTKRQLAVILSRLKGFSQPKRGDEQYVTESDFAAEIAWNAFYRLEIEGKCIADLGCGTGVLGLSTLLLGAKQVFFVDIDKDALSVAKENLAFLEQTLDVKLVDRAIFICKEVIDFDEKVDVVVQNPPFGIQGKKHADRIFLEHAFGIADVIYSFHKIESEKFIDAISRDHGFIISQRWRFKWPLKQTMEYHRKRIQYIEVGCWRLEKTM